MADLLRHFASTAYGSRRHILRQSNCAVPVVSITLQCCKKVNCDSRLLRDSFAWRAPEPPKEVMIVIDIHVNVVSSVKATSCRELLPAAVKDGYDIASLYAAESP